METVELNILRYRQHLRDLLNLSLKESPVLLFLIKDIRTEIEFCNQALNAVRDEKLKIS